MDINSNSNSYRTKPTVFNSNANSNTNSNAHSDANSTAKLKNAYKASTQI